MLLDNWNALATGLAAYVRDSLPHARRGALAIRLPSGVGQVVGVFGNDGYAADGRVKREVAALRLRLREMALEEVGFGLSEDGQTWALLVGSASSESQTTIEALVTFLEDAVREAWRLACEVPRQGTSTAPPEVAVTGPRTAEVR